ncbi:MAG: hypothetical protein WCI71_15545 [Bacteroidota bacterium]
MPQKANRKKQQGDQLSSGNKGNKKKSARKMKSKYESQQLSKIVNSYGAILR